MSLSENRCPPRIKSGAGFFRDVHQAQHAKAGAKRAPGARRQKQAHRLKPILSEIVPGLVEVAPDLRLPRPGDGTVARVLEALDPRAAIPFGHDVSLDRMPH
jgi:hypothetical protein